MGARNRIGAEIAALYAAARLWRISHPISCVAGSGRYVFIGMLVGCCVSYNYREHSVIRGNVFRLRYLYKSAHYRYL